MNLRFDHEQLLQMLPFAALAAVGQASAFWPPGPKDFGAFWMSSFLLLVSGLLAIPTKRTRPETRLMMAGIYVASVALLMLSTGGVASGLGSLLLIPVVGAALYGRRLDSAAVVAAVLGAMLAVSLAGPHQLSETARRLGLFSSMGALLSVSIHTLRARLAESREKLAEQATSEERRRIARELHDGLAHELAFIASKTRKNTTNTFATVEQRALAYAADRALDEARRAITVLSSSRPQPLAQAIAQTAEDLGARLGIDVVLDLRNDLDMPGDVTENLLRVVREAITNAANHGGSRRVTVRLERKDGVRLTVEDDGKGFDVSIDCPSSSFGLLSMRERAAAVGAELRVDSSPAHGTRVEVAFP